jgi:hypothetical protein
MRNNLKMAGALLVIVGAVLGTAIGISLVGASADDDAARYEVTVRFNTSVTQRDIEEVDALLSAYYDDLGFVVMESFPPVGGAILNVDADDFCRTVEADLEAASYVEAVSCQPWEEADGEAPDDTISTDNDAN